MARSKNFFDDVTKELECSVCQEQFSEINEPKILRCLHTFCKTCLEAWLRRQREGELSCPTCRQITECSNNNINSLPSNLFCKQLVEIVEAYSGKGQENSPHCGICDEKKSLKFYCSDCNGFLCDDCFSTHKKGKVFKGHQVKEIGNFESSDVEDYARRANFCKKHKDEMRFYCEKCQICICLNCAILEHQDHNKISLDQGLENNQHEIEIKVREVEENYTRLRSYKDSLEKRRLQVNGSIEEATKEVKRVAERCILLIRQHEASVTERLVEQKAASQVAFDTQMTSLDGKLMEIENTLAFSEEVLLRKNLPEILNVKSTIEQRLQELSVPYEATPKLGYSGVKYVQSDVSFLKEAPGKLVTTDTEPLLSVVEGKSLAEGLVGEDCSFTVITKNSARQTTYSEIDELNVKITSLSKDKDNIKTVVTDLKDGRYSISYRPTTPGEFTVFIEVDGNEIVGSPFKLKVSTGSQYSKQEKTTLLKSTRSRIMSDNSDTSMEQVVSSVLQREQELSEGVFSTVKPYLDTMLCNSDQHFEVFELVSAKLCLEFMEHLSREQTKTLLVDIADKNGVKWIESSEDFIISGTFKQVEESRAYLQQNVHTDHKASSTSPEIQSFEIEPKIVKVFVKAYKTELDDIETKYHVEIPRKTEKNKLRLKPKDRCSADDYEEACNQFITLYQSMYQLIKMERFSFKGETKIINARQSISQIGKMFPISVEKCKDHKHWEMYGEASHIEEALKHLENEGVGINREKENEVDEKVRRKQSKDNEEAMDVDPHEHSRGDKNPGNLLETFLDLPAGKVKVSVYKSDITNERVDVIVNAANRYLQHFGGVAKAILDKGGKQIMEESRAIIKKRGVLKDGEAVNTKSGNLPCKAVVHAVGPIWQDVGPKKSRNVLRRACLNSFIETEKLNMTSIALPAVGSGIYGMPKDVCAEVMFDAVDEFVRQGGIKKKKITDIRFVNIDDPSVQAFTKEFYNRYGDDLESSSSGKASPTGVVLGDSSVPISRSNRGRDQSKNNPHTTNPNSAASAAKNDHPLIPFDHTASSNSSYSNAVKGNTAGCYSRPPIAQQPQSQKAKWAFSLPLKEGDGVTADKKEEETCPICLDSILSPRSLKCKHVFCSGCLQTALDVCNKCPVCLEPQGVLQGNQPRGDMRFRTECYSSVPGYEGYGTIIIDYRFPSGVQGPEHPHPGQYYKGTSRTAYLPDTREGREVLQLLRRAFDARLVFTVGASITTGIPNQVIWNDIHHKTSVRGGSYGFGYPDPDYLRRVKEELAAKGIR